MDKLVLILHIVACVLLILFVLLQSGKEGMGVIFGGGSSSLFGSTGAGGILVKLTTFVAVVFLCTSLGYNIITSTGGGNASRITPLLQEGSVSGPADATEDSPDDPAQP
ncbi:MAG: preprotein translocase subunit SecG [Deltaproteobacteria bacterium]|nr:preprotein translocase subunit SecG [Deltaproteobacteria bacterium]